MKVSEYINYLVQGDASKLAISNVGEMGINPSVTPTAIQLVNQGKFLNFVNLANLALHKRFGILEKTIELDLPIDGEEYALPSDFLIPSSAHYTSDLEEISIKDKHVKMVSGVDTAVSILFPASFTAVIKGTDSEARDQIILTYIAAPCTCTTVSTDLLISEIYTEALLQYATYKAYGTISGDIKDENNSYFLRYESSVKQLVTSGMYGNNQIETNTKLVDNGFV